MLQESQSDFQLASRVIKQEQQLLNEVIENNQSNAQLSTYGSLSTGHFYGWHGERVGDTRLHGAVELDILCRLPVENMPTLAKDFIKSLGYQGSHSGILQRWAQNYNSIVLQKNIQVADQRQFTIEILMIDDTYIPIDSYWRAVFTNQEIEWQRNVREYVSIFGDDILYFETKCLQVRECRWRTISAYAAMRDAVLCQKSDIPEFARKDIPNELKLLVNEWDNGNLDLKDLVRPMTQFIPGVKNILEKHADWLLDAPPVEPFYEVALNRQWEIAISKAENKIERD